MTTERKDSRLYKSSLTVIFLVKSSFLGLKEIEENVEGELGW